jgi:hypothetical protein
MTGLIPRAVIIGSLVDNAGTLVANAVFGALVAQLAGATSVEDLATVIEGSIALQAVQLALGLSFTAVGAYVAAQLATGNERTNAFAVGVLSTLIGFLFVFTAPESAPFWVEAAGLLLTIPAAFLGGELRLAVVRMKST